MFKEDEDFLEPEEVPARFREEYTGSSEQKRPCPHCHQSIPDDAVRCFFCGESVPVQSGLMSWLRDQAATIWFLIVVAMIIFSFLMIF